MIAVSKNRSALASQHRTLVYPGAITLICPVVLSREWCWLLNRPSQKIYGDDLVLTWATESTNLTEENRHLALLARFGWESKMPDREGHPIGFRCESPENLQIALEAIKQRFLECGKPDEFKKIEVGLVTQICRLLSHPLAE